MSMSCSVCNNKSIPDYYPSLAGVMNKHPLIYPNLHIVVRYIFKRRLYNIVTKRNH